MAGHSHSANIKWKKDRKDQERSRDFLKLRKTIETLITKEKRITSETLNLARKHSFPKEKIYQIWEKWKESQNKEKPILCNLYQASFGIVIYLEGNDNKKTNQSVSVWEDEFQLRKVDKEKKFSYFKKFNILKIKRLIKDKEVSFEEYLLKFLPSEIINQIEQMSFHNDLVKIIFAEKKTGKEIEKLIKDGDHNLSIEEKKNIWQPLIFQELVSEEAKDYRKRLEKKADEIDDINFYTNCQELG